MPFIGQDWRAPGETWVKTTEGWEQMKLRPLRTCSDVSLDSKLRIHTDSESSVDNYLYSIDDQSTPSPIDFGLCDVVEESSSDDWLPHCFVKTTKSKEFVGCASMSEAFLKLDLARAVTDVRRFNYVCKITQILIRDRLKHLSGSGRKILLALIEAITMHCLTDFKELNNVRALVSDFLSGLHGGQHCGSPKLLSQHQDAVSNLFTLLTNVQLETPADSNEDSVTFLDLPKECLRAILAQLNEHESLLTAAKAHEALEMLVHAESNIWRDLCRFHFTQCQIETTINRLNKQIDERRRRTKQLIAEQKENLIVKTPDYMNMINSCACDEDQLCEFDGNEPKNITWRHLYFENKKYFGLKEIYADMIHICCQCKALFWKGLGHPCVGDGAPSVRVTPQQFIDMLLYS